MAMPRAYWLWNPDQKHFELSDQLLLAETNETEFARVLDAIEHAASNKYDMDIMNDLYLGSAVVLPHREYDLLTGEFRKDPGDHANYLGNKDDQWVTKDVLATAKFLHFSDYPIPKVSSLDFSFFISVLTRTIAALATGKLRRAGEDRSEMS